MNGTVDVGDEERILLPMSTWILYGCIDTQAFCVRAEDILIGIVGEVGMA